MNLIKANVALSIRERSSATITHKLGSNLQGKNAQVSSSLWMMQPTINKITV
jgi:hypothetical protein